MSYKVVNFVFLTSATSCIWSQQIQNKSLGKLRKRNRKKETETKAKNMEREICKLQKTLEDRGCQLEASSSTATKNDCLLSHLEHHFLSSNHVDILMNHMVVEPGTDKIEMQVGAVEPGERAIIIG
ncbi:hypothetical protein Bca4012_068029 [Brassica carinata]